MKQHLIMLITMIISCYGASDHVGESDMPMITDSIVPASDGGDALELQDVVWETTSTPYPNQQESRPLFESGSVQPHRQNDENEPPNVVDYKMVIGMRWTDNHGNQWMINSEGVPKPQNIEPTTNGDGQQQQGSRQGDFVQLRSARELNHYPIDDSAPASLAQQNFWKQMGISADVQQDIYEFCDEIASLFRLFTSPEDRMDILGFESYEEMNRVHPTKQQKIQHFDDAFWRQSGRFHVVIYFGNLCEFIKTICVEDKQPDDHITIINWDALAGFANLEDLKLKHLQMPVSMDDIQKVPGTVTNLVIPGNHWTGDDVDLNLFPLGLKFFSANDCRGMEGRMLTFPAPNSKLNLQSVSVERTDILLDVGPETKLHPCFSSLIAHHNVGGEEIQVLKDKGVKVWIGREEV